MQWNLILAGSLRLGQTRSDTLPTARESLIALLPPSFTVGSGQDRMPAETDRPPTGWHGAAGLFGEIHAVDQETRPRPDGASAFAAAPPRPGAPVYTAVYLGLRIPL